MVPCNTPLLTVGIIVFIFWWRWSRMNDEGPQHSDRQNERERERQVGIADHEGAWLYVEVLLEFIAVYGGEVVYRKYLWVR